MVALAVHPLPGNPANLANVAQRLCGVPDPSTRSALSTLAWSADRFAYGEWIERSGFADFPWTISFEGRREAQRRRQFALAKGEAAGSLTERSGEVLRDAVRWCFSDASWCLLLGWIQTCGLQVSGVRAGARTVIDELLLPHLVVDLEHDMATTCDRESTWHALALEWPASKAEAAASSPFTPLPMRTLQGEFVQWYRDAYPTGHPIGKKQDELAYEATRTLGRKVSARTVRRALHDFRPRTTPAR